MLSCLSNYGYSAARPAPGHKPVAPPRALEWLRDHLDKVITNGTVADQKSLVEALIHEVRITEEGLIPVYRIPAAPDQPEPDGDPVRTMVHLVGRTYRCANHVYSL